MISQDAIEMRAMVIACGGGLEIHQDDWPTAEEIVADDKAFKLGAARGPDRLWKRLYIEGLQE